MGLRTVEESSIVGQIVPPRPTRVNNIKPGADAVG